ncbi:hypothetical protein PVNG_01095 [Plasmodium vivax North Korean]|uniref:Protein kinase domain-containing protein n=1 Tax=Plasmodium vivax North Korean TaxID=1035514 RepID=A0A0J9TWS8_PLAVI|nr:hypothetical protein PVNG_01095 [Plasmodium vivax North Korean]
MQRIRREDYLRKCKNRDDFVYAHVRDILSHQPFDEILPTIAPFGYTSRTLFLFFPPKLEYQNGDVYIGTTKNRKRHGYGYYVYKEIGSVYQGEWIENAKSGYGTLYNSWGIVYSGEWLNNISHGFGCTYANEQLFLGTYKFGLINGVGILKKNTSYNFCLFESNRKKCKIKITKNMEVFLHCYKKDKLFLKEKLGAFFPLYADSTISRLVRQQIFRHLFGVDKSFGQFFAKGGRSERPNGGIGGGINGGASGGFLSYVNYESRINFLKGLISKGAKGGRGEETHPDGSVGSTDDSVWNSPSKGETNQRNGCNVFPFGEDKDPRGDFPSREAAKRSTRHQTSNEGRSPLFVEASIRGASRLYNSNDFFKCIPHLTSTHLLYKSDEESGSEFCPDVTPSSASSLERHFKVKQKVTAAITAAIRPVFHSNRGASEKRIITQRRQRKGRRSKLYKLLVGGGPKGEGALSNDPSEWTAECRGAQWGSVHSTGKAALVRSTLRGKAVAGRGKEMPRVQRRSHRAKKPPSPPSPPSPLTLPTAMRLLTYLQRKNEKNQIECIYQWRSYHIFVLLRLFGLHKYIAAFKGNHISGFHFFTLNRNMLKMLGVDKHEHMYFLLNFVNAFSSLHDMYLQMLVPWGNITGDALLTFSSLPKSELVVLSRLGRHSPGEGASYLCYYANAPVRLKMFSGKEGQRGQSGREAPCDKPDDAAPNGDSSTVRNEEGSASPCGDGTSEGMHSHLGNPLLSAAHKFLLDEQQLSNIGESILDGWGSIRSNLASLEAHEVFRRLKGGGLPPRAQAEGNHQRGGSVKQDAKEDVAKEDDAQRQDAQRQDAHDEAATLVERIQRRTAFMKEHFVLSNLRHPNVIKYIGNVISRKKEKFGLVFECLRGMCLHDAIRDAIRGGCDAQRGQRQTCGAEGRSGAGRKALTNESVIRLFYEIAAALFYLHSKRVVHGNISSKNIFVSEDGGGVKLCNFEKASIESYYDYKLSASGGARLDGPNERWCRCCRFYPWGEAEKGGIPNGHSNRVRSKRIGGCTPPEGEKMNLPLPYITCMNEVKNIKAMVTSPLLLFQAKKFEKRTVRCDDPYAAPEVLREEECTAKCDVYAFGVVMHEVLFGGPPLMSEFMPSFFWTSTCFHQKYLHIDVDKLHGRFPNRKLFHLVVSNVLLVMRQCLSPEPTCRPDSAYLCRHFGRLLDRSAGHSSP